MQCRILTSCRYGSIDYTDPDEKECFLERKTHHESFTHEDSVKERFPLRFHHVPEWIAGKWQADSSLRKMAARGKLSQKELESCNKLATEAQEQVRIALVCIFVLFD